MFNLQKSSKSSADDNLQINLLYPNDRESRMDTYRPQNRIANPRSILQPLHRGSEHLPPPTDLDSPQPNYSVMAAQKIDPSESILTNSGQNSRIVGLILFLLFIAFTPAETYSLTLTKWILSIHNPTAMMLLLLSSQICAFVVLYYYGWVDRFTLLGSYLARSRRSARAPVSLMASPYFFMATIFVLTGLWQLAYTVAITNGRSIYLVVFYMIVLPQIAVPLMEQPVRGRYLWILVVVMGYLGLCALMFSWSLLVGSLVGMMLIYFSSRGGRVCILIEYLAKMAIFVGLMVYVLIARDWHGVGDLTKIDVVGFGQMVLLVLLSAIAIIVVRCLNNRILRVELYKYFYSDAEINCGLLLLPGILGYLENRGVDLWVGVVGCGVLFALVVKLSRQKTDINFNIPIEDKITVPTQAV